MKYSPLQMDIFHAVRTTRDNVAVLATAGAGKTTTILQCLTYIPLYEKSVFLSFSKAIVTELSSRVPRHISASTLHGLGYKYINNYLKRKIEVDTDKYFKFALKMMKDSKGGAKAFLDKKEFRSCYLTQDVCAYARMTLTDYADRNAIIEMCTYYNIEFDETTVQFAMKLLEKYALNTDTPTLDFVDMIYWPANMPELCTERFHNVFLDEAQDTNRCQLKLVENILAEDGRLISVGDDYQCIYGFSGADVEAFKRIRERPNTITLPLSVTYRCPKSVVRKAQEVCEFIQHHEHADEGVVRAGQWEEIGEGDMVLSRVTKPLVQLYFRLIDANIKAHIVGKDIEKGLLSLMEQVMDDQWIGVKQRIVEKRKEKEDELLVLGIKFPTEHPQYRALDDKIQVLEVIFRKVNGPREVPSKIREIFHEDKRAARLMTIHRSKGLENDRVFLLEEAEGMKLMPSKWAKQNWEHTQENNLIFVAVTRAKKELITFNLND